MDSFERAERLRMGACFLAIGIFSVVKGVKGARARAAARTEAKVVEGRSAFNRAPREKLKNKNWRKPRTINIKSKRFNRSSPSIKQKNRMACEALDKDGGHSNSDHGSHVTEAQHEIRLKTGRAPSGRVAGIPDVSSSFVSDEMHLKAYVDALARLETEKFNTRGGLKKKVEIPTKPLMGAGNSFSLDPLGSLVFTPADSYTAFFFVRPSQRQV